MGNSGIRLHLCIVIALFGAHRSILHSLYIFSCCNTSSCNGRGIITPASSQASSSEITRLQDLAQVLVAAANLGLASMQTTDVRTPQPGSFAAYPAYIKSTSCWTSCAINAINHPDYQRNAHALQ
jgi:hypothetical protein